MDIEYRNNCEFWSAFAYWWGRYELPKIKNLFYLSNLTNDTGFINIDTLPSLFQKKVINNNIVKDIILSHELQHFYYANYPRFPGDNTTSVLKNINWNLTTFGSNTATGYFVLNGAPAVVGGVAKNETRYLRQGAIIKFVPRAGYYFDTSNNMIPGTAPIGSNNSIYACVTTVYGNGTNNGTGNLDDGTGPVILNVKVPTGAVIAEVIPVFKNGFTSFYNEAITGLIKSFKNFGLTFDVEKQIWKIISSEDLNTSGQFSLTNQNNISGTGLDSSWLIRFEYNLDGYIVYYRGIEYTFESAGQTGFFFDDRVKVYDTKTGTVVNDQVTVLKTNRQPDSNFHWRKIVLGRFIKIVLAATAM
jgi:hypothetical protein